MEISSEIDFDHFFYGEEITDLEAVINADLLLEFLTPRGSLFFARENGSNVFRRQNVPAALFQDMILRYDIADANARRTARLGQPVVRDYRVAISQDSIKVNRENGAAVVDVGYFRLQDLEAGSLRFGA